MAISEVTRRNIFDQLRIDSVEWAGRLEETQFLGRLYNLQELPSTDPRFRTAEGDIWKHRIMNRDWDDFWVFDDNRFDLLRGPDDVFLRFCCEMLHPIVRPDLHESEEIFTLLNGHLRTDGWEIVKVSEISGLPVFGATQLIDGVEFHINAAEQVANGLGPDYISRQIIRIRTSIEADPELAIGTAKEFVETVCKSILDERGVEHHDANTVPALVKKTAKELKLAPDDIPDRAKAVETIRVLLSNLAAVSGGLAELRNPYGTGHGKNSTHRGLAPRHARLAAGAAIALAAFLFETNDER